MQQAIQQSLEQLIDIKSPAYRHLPVYNKPLPSLDKLKEVVDIIREIIFPGFFGNSLVTEQTLRYHTGVDLDRLFHLLSEQIYNAHLPETEGEAMPGEAAKQKESAKQKAVAFIEKLSEVKHLLSTDVKAIFDNDPAAKHFGEIIFCYPAVKAILNYRVAHELLLLEIPMIPRIISELAHAETGIDIHPGATIGEYFSIDHGTGVVIGQTAIIGNHVCLYQGVTLGAKSFTLDEAGIPIDVPRHPILEDNVTVYSNSSILGRITIGKGTVIGGNVWLTHSVAPNSRILQSKVQERLFIDGLGI